MLLLTPPNGNGRCVLAENQKLIDSDYLLVQDADLGKVRSVRRKNKSVKDAVSLYGKITPMRSIDCGAGALRSDGTLYHLEKLLGNILAGEVFIRPNVRIIRRVCICCLPYTFQRIPHRSFIG